MCTVNETVRQPGEPLPFLQGEEDDEEDAGAEALAQALAAIPNFEELRHVGGSESGWVRGGFFVGVAIRGSGVSRVLITQRVCLVLGHDKRRQYPHTPHPSTHLHPKR